MFRFQKASLVEQVAEALRREIADGRCRGWLPTERALCEQLRVSRRTLRCALEQLKQRGLVAARVGVGTRVVATAAPGPAGPPAAQSSVGLLMPEPIDVLRPYVTLWIDLLKTELFGAGVALGVHVGRHYFRRGGGQALRRLVMFSETRPSPGAAAAEEGFLGQIRAHGGGTHGEVLRPEPTPRGYRRAVEHLLGIRPCVTAILSLNPLLGATVVTTLMHLGRRLPDDLSFATTYGDPFMRFLSPEPTRYAYPPAAFARKLARVALQLVHGEAPTVRHARLVPTLVPGETLGPAPGEQA